MTTTALSGPLVIGGSQFGFPSGGVPESNPDAGPSVIAQGIAIPDVRYPIQKDYLDRGGVVPSFLLAPTVVAIDATPATASTTAIAAAAAVTSGTAMTLATGNTAGCSPGTPMLPFGSSTVVTATCLEMGFTSGDTTAGSGTIASIPVAGVQQMWPGQWIVIPNVGNSGGTSALITQVQTIASATTVTVSPAPAASLTGARIGQADKVSNLWGGGSATYHVPGASIPEGGPALLWDPRQLVSRTLSITATNAGATGGAFTVRGYDAYGVAMTETITHAGNATTKYGVKCFKWVTSVTPGFTDTQTYSVGFADQVGLPLRSDLFEYIDLWYAGARITASTGWTAGSTSTPSATTADVRGSIAIGTVNNAGAGVSGGAFNGSRRLSVRMTIPLHALLAGTPSSNTALFGLTQA